MRNNLRKKLLKILKTHQLTYLNIEYDDDTFIKIGAGCLLSEYYRLKYETDHIMLYYNTQSKDIIRTLTMISDPIVNDITMSTHDQENIIGPIISEVNKLNRKTYDIAYYVYIDIYKSLYGKYTN